MYACPAWTVESPSGRRWTGFPTLQGAHQFAYHLASIEAMLAHITVEAA